MVDVADGRIWSNVGPGAPFTMHAKDQDYGKQRYYKEANRLYGVLDRQLAANEFVAGKDLSIADMAIFPGRAQSGVKVSILIIIRMWCGGAVC